MNSLVNISRFFKGALDRTNHTDLLACNEKTLEYGLSLTQTEAVELAQTRRTSLNENGLVEVGVSSTVSLIEAFADSGYLTMNGYADTLGILTDAFYYYKAEIPSVSDKQLIEFMKESFDGVCGGDTELLLNRELPRLAYNLNNNLPKDAGRELTVMENLTDDRRLESFEDTEEYNGDVTNPDITDDDIIEGCYYIKEPEDD